MELRKKLPADVMLSLPSRNRARWLWNRTNHTLKYVAHMDPVFFVRDDDPQLETYREYAKAHGVEVTLQDSTGCFGVSQAYDMLINRAVKEGKKVLLIVDDDMQFKIWNPIPGQKPDIRRITGDVLTEMFCQWADLLSPQMPAVCLLPIARRTQERLLRYSAPVMWCYGFYVPHFAAHPEHRFYQGRDIEARCDINLGLALNGQGYLTSYMSTLIIPNEVNNPGGCSSYRTLEVEERSTDYMVAKYPGIVREIVSKGWGLDQPEVMRRSVSVAWRKSFNAAQFAANHKMDPQQFKFDTLMHYERVYAEFVRSMREENRSYLGEVQDDDA